MAVSIRDVAKAANVSVGTVSRAFNDYKDIKEETKQLILEKARELGYVPNLNAKILSGKKYQTLAIILVGFLADRGLTNELVIKMLRGACLYAQDHQLEFATYILSSEQQKEKSFEQFCNEHSLDGAICFGLKTTDVYYESLKNTKTPCVTVDVPLTGECVGYIGTDDTRAYDELTQLVLRQGHRRFVFLNGRETATVCQERLNGLNAALSRAGLELEETFFTDFNADLAEEIVTYYLKKHGTGGATAFMCASDFVALGACKAIQKCGYTVGRDFAVAGFDGMDFARLSQPPIATVDQNMEKKGFSAAKMLYEIVNNQAKSNYCNIPYTIIPGESISPCGV